MGRRSISARAMNGWLFTVPLALVLLLCACHSAREKAQVQLKVEQHRKTVRAEQQIADLRSQQSADVDLPEKLNGKLHTIDVVPIFLRPVHRSFLFFAMLEDVRR